MALLINELWKYHKSVALPRFGFAVAGSIACLYLANQNTVNGRPLATALIYSFGFGLCILITNAIARIVIFLREPTNYERLFTQTIPIHVIIFGVGSILGFLTTRLWNQSGSPNDIIAFTLILTIFFYCAFQTGQKNIHTLILASPRCHQSLPDQHLYVTRGDQTIVLNFESITCCVSKDHYTHIYTQTREYLYGKSIAQLEKTLPAARFLRVHRRCIVSLSSIVSISKGKMMSVLLKNQMRFNVSRRSRRRVKDLIARDGVATGYTPKCPAESAIDFQTTTFEV